MIMRKLMDVSSLSCERLSEDHGLKREIEQVLQAQVSDESNEKNLDYSCTPRTCADRHDGRSTHVVLYRTTQKDSKQELRSKASSRQQLPVFYRPLHLDYRSASSGAVWRTWFRQL